MAFLFTLRSQAPTNNPPQFYIQCKGNHSGRPLKRPIPSSFAVYTDCENLYSLIYALYVGKVFQPIIRGSVIPFITIDDSKKIIRRYCHLHTQDDLFKQMEKIDSLVEITKQKLKLLEEMKRAFCYQALKNKN